MDIVLSTLFTTEFWYYAPILSTLTVAIAGAINGKFDNITRQDLLTFAQQNNIKDASSIIDEICEAASRWPQIARECDVPTEMINTIVPNLLLNL